MKTDVRKLLEDTETPISLDDITEGDALVILDHHKRALVDNLPQILAPLVLKGLSLETQGAVELAVKDDSALRDSLLQAAGLARKVKVLYSPGRSQEFEVESDQEVVAFAQFNVSDRTRNVLNDLEEKVGEIPLEMNLRSDSVSVYEESTQDFEKNIREKVCSTSSKFVTAFVGMILLTSALAPSAQAASTVPHPTMAVQTQVMTQQDSMLQAFNTFKSKVDTLTTSATAMQDIVHDSMTEINHFKGQSSVSQFDLQKINNADPGQFVTYSMSLNSFDMWNGNKSAKMMELESVSSELGQMVQNLKNIDRSDPSLQGMDFTKVDNLINALNTLKAQTTDVQVHLTP